MPELLKPFLSAQGFIPHGHCYLWKPELLWLHIVSDSLIAVAYYSIPVMLVYFVRTRRDVPFDWIFLMFGSFIIACGTTHLLEVWTLWHPTYWLSGFIKLITALVSVRTAMLLAPLIPKALALPSPAQLEVSNLALRNEIIQRQLAEDGLHKAYEELELRVQERTTQLAKINESLQAEIESHKQTEVALLRRGRQLEILSRANHEINTVLEIPVVMRTLIASAIELVEAAAGTYGLMSQGKMVFTEYNENGTVRPIDVTFEPGIGVPGWVMETLKPYVSNDAEHDPHILPHLQKAFGFYNLANIPIFNRQGELIGCFELHNKADRRAFSDNDIIRLQGLANSAAVALENSQMLVERKQAEEELQKSYNLVQSVIEGTPDSIFVKDIQGCYVMLNSACASVIGRSVAAILGKDDTAFWSPAIAHYLMETDRQIMTTGETRILEENVPIHGKLRTYLSTKSVWRNSQGNVIGLIGIARDITDRKRTEQQIKQLNEDLEHRVIERTAQLAVANKELEAFSYSVSHDLRAPLRGIDGFSQALLDRYAEQLDDKGKHYLQRIRANTQRMGQLIDDLLKLSRVTRSEMQRTNVDLSILAQEIAAELHSSQPERQVEWEIAPKLIANGDTRLLRVVLENLLNNAWKFTSNRRHAHIEFGKILEKDCTTAYFVRDNGAGFDMAYANKLFGAFQRLHPTTQFPGTGIGLATVQRIIHRHGGRVWAEGTVEQGATFYFTLS